MTPWPTRPTRSRPTSLTSSSTLSITDVIKKFLAIVATTVLQSTEKFLVAVLDVFAQLVQGMMDVLTTKLDIPILSWLYNELTGEDLSFLDVVVCPAAAIPVTIIYKVAAQVAPFPANDAFTNGVAPTPRAWPRSRRSSAAESPRPAAVQRRRVRDGQRYRGTPLRRPTMTHPSWTRAKLKTFGFVTGIVSLIGGAVLVVVTTIQRTADLLGFGIVYAKTLATIGCIGDIAYVSPNIATLINAKTDNWYADFNNAVTGVSILKGIAAIPAAPAYDNPGHRQGLWLRRVLHQRVVERRRSRTSSPAKTIGTPPTSR